MMFWTEERKSGEKYRVFGAGDEKQWLQKIKIITMNINNCTEDVFISLCEKQGIKISYPKKFIEIYYRGHDVGRK